MKKSLTIGGIFFVVVTFMAGLTASHAGTPSYVGPEGCKCHKTEMEEWSKAKHSNAFERLVIPSDKKEEKKRARLFAKLNEKLKPEEQLDPAKDYSKDKKCLPCHTVGYGQPGGFVDMEKTPALAGVGCEMCHGPGSEYRVIHKEKEKTFTRAENKAAGAVYGTEDEKVCRKCHDNPDSPMRSSVDEKYKFDWKEFLSLDKTYHKVYPTQYKH